MDVLVEALRWLADGQNWSGSSGIGTRLVEHVWLTLVSVAIAAAIAVPLGLWLGHIGRGGAVAINVSNVGRAIPTFAILVLLFLSPLGLSIWSTVIALVLFAVPPMLTNTYVGMRAVDRNVVAAARGMGMSAGQVLRKVELPLAMPLLMTGVRLAAVQVVATATLAAFVAGPGLGRIITNGFGRQDTAQIVAGAICVAVLALVAEGVLELVQRVADPVARVSRHDGAAQASSTTTDSEPGRSPIVGAA